MIEEQLVSKTLNIKEEGLDTSTHCKNEIVQKKYIGNETVIGIGELMCFSQEDKLLPHFSQTQKPQQLYVDRNTLRRLTIKTISEIFHVDNCTNMRQTMKDHYGS